jgi:Galactosyltransferase
LDVKFFRGRGATRDPLADEVFLDCGDAYLEIPEKVQAVMKWAYENGYDYVAKVDDDVVVKPNEWYAGFHRADFSGWQDPSCKPGEIRTPWGFFYVLSRRSMELIINAPLPGRAGALHNHIHGNDEAWVASVLHYQNIFLTSDTRYFLYMGQKPNTRGRALRSLIRPEAAPRVPSSNWYAACIYLNWSGWHSTGTDVILREFYRIFKEGL